MRFSIIGWLAAALAIPRAAAAQSSDVRGTASLGLQYNVAGGGTARTEPFSYPTMAAAAYGSWWSAEARTPLAVAVLDAVMAAIDYVASEDGDASLPIWTALNGERKHSRIPAFSLDARLALLRRGSERVDLGLHGELVGTFFEVEGERRNAHFINVGPSLGYAIFEPDGSAAVVLATTVGNGFGHRADLNPFMEGSVFARKRIASPFGVYARSQIGVQWIDYRPASNDTETELDLIDPVAYGSFELGILFEI